MPGLLSAVSASLQTTRSTVQAAVAAAASAAADGQVTLQSLLTDAQAALKNAQQRLDAATGTLNSANKQVSTMNQQRCCFFKGAYHRHMSIHHELFKLTHCVHMLLSHCRPPPSCARQQQLQSQQQPPSMRPAARAALHLLRLATSSTPLTPRSTRLRQLPTRTSTLHSRPIGTPWQRKC